MTDQNRDDKTTFRRYILHLPPVGHGGMGEVYRATDRLTQRQVALKRLLTGAGDFARDALAQEFRILTSLQHPNIVAVQDYGLDSQQQPYFTMEFLDNAELMSDLDSSVSIYERTEYLIHLLQALVYLERRGILHRDLKPDNALIDEHNMIKVLDFGLSLEFKNFQSSGIVGTIRYMAPEVLQEQQITVATDLFAVGVIAYELFTGEHPFDTSSTMKLIQDILSSDPDFDLLSSIVLSTIHINQPAGEPPETQGASASDMTGVDTLPDTETVLSLEIPPIKTETLTEENVIIKDSPDETFDDLSETVIADEKHIRTNLTLSNEPIDLQDNDTTMREGLMASQSDPADDVPAIVHVVRKLLEKNPEDRYQSPGEVIEAICMALGLDIPEETETIRAGFLQNARFIGREDSSKQLADALTDLRQGQGSFWLIGGESGAGKSRLIDEFTDYGLLEGVTIIRGQAKDDIENSLWQNPIRHYCLQVDFPVRDIQILLPYFPEINDLLETDYAPAKPLQSKAQRNRLNQTIARVFALSNEPLVIILEDLQWAGDDLDALELLTALSGDAPLMIISAYRDDEASDLPEKLKPAPENHIVLERLDQTEIRELSIAILGDEGDQDRLIEYLEKETEGNVFFLVEILRALAEESGELAAILRMEMPENIEVTPIQRIIEKQLSFVPDSALPLLETAALAGRYLDTDVLSAIAEQDSIDDWLRICANVSVIERQDEQWRFRHDKLREGLLAGLDEARLKLLHLSIARAIESAYPGKLQQYAESLAHHYRMADLPEKETRFAFLAGESRFSRAIFPLALEYLERAMAIRPPDDAVFHAQLLRRLSQTYHGLTRYDDALKFARDGLVLAEKIGDLVLIATLHNVLGRVYMAQRKLDPAQQEYDSVQEIATQTGDTDNLALAKFNSATIRLIQDNYDEALPILNDALALFEHVENQEFIGNCKINIGLIHLEKGDFEQAERYLEEASKISNDLANLQQLIVISFNRGAIAEDRGQYQHALTIYESALITARQIQNQYWIARALRNAGQVHYHQQDYVRSQSLLTESIDIQRRVGNEDGITWSIAYLGCVYCRTGTYRNARSTFLEGLEYAVESHDRRDVARQLIGLLVTDVEVDNFEEAARIVAYLQANYEGYGEFAGYSVQVLGEQIIINLSETAYSDAMTEAKSWSQEDMLQYLT